MTRKEALEELIAKVEVGEWPSRGAYLIPGEFRPADPGSAFNGSLDAAKALHDAVLPGWIWDVGPQNDAGQISACVTLRSDQSVQSCETVYHNPARAWLLAILRALRAQEASA